MEVFPRRDWPVLSCPARRHKSEVFQSMLEHTSTLEQTSATWQYLDVPKPCNVQSTTYGAQRQELRVLIYMYVVCKVKAGISSISGFNKIRPITYMYSTYFMHICSYVGMYMLQLAVWLPASSSFCVRHSLFCLGPLVKGAEADLQCVEEIA